MNHSVCVCVYTHTHTHTHTHTRACLFGDKPVSNIHFQKLVFIHETFRTMHIMGLHQSHKMAIWRTEKEMGG